MAPQWRPQLTQLAARLVAQARLHQQAARVGARALKFRQRWAVLSAAGIYGAIASEVGRRGEQAWDSRVYTSKLTKLGFVARAFFAALLPAPKLAELPRWNRRQLSAR